jgi:hypothetical protein
MEHFSVIQDTKLKFYKVVATPALLHGCKSWFTTQQAAEMTFFMQDKRMHKI